jgi:hypothetical protein
MTIEEESAIIETLVGIPPSAWPSHWKSPNFEPTNSEKDAFEVFWWVVGKEAEVSLTYADDTWRVFVEGITDDGEKVKGRATGMTVSRTLLAAAYEFVKKEGEA